MPAVPLVVFWIGTSNLNLVNRAQSLRPKKLGLWNQSWGKKRVSHEHNGWVAPQTIESLLSVYVEPALAIGKALPRDSANPQTRPMAT